MKEATIFANLVFLPLSKLNLNFSNTAITVNEIMTNNRK